MSTSMWAYYTELSIGAGLRPPKGSYKRGRARLTRAEWARLRAEKFRKKTAAALAKQQGPQ